MWLNLMLEFFLLGLIGGLLGIFYRNCLKPGNMIFNWWYYNVLEHWVIEGHLCVATKWDKFKRWIAFPLGYCIYCSATWITFFLCIIYLSSWEVLPKWQDILIGIIFASGIQHLVVCIACRFLIKGHHDLDNDIE